VSAKNTLALIFLLKKLEIDYEKNNLSAKAQGIL